MRNGLTKLSNVDEPNDPTVQVGLVGAVATIGWRRPALDAAAKTELREVLRSVACDDSVRAVVLTGAGRTFCVGQDLAEHAAALDADPATAFDTVEEHYAPIVQLIATMPKPVVAAVRGACVGAGLGIALACDLRVVADDARFGTAFSSIGLTCDSGLAATLVRSVGHSRASQLVLLAHPFTAAEAVAFGIAADVVADHDVASAAQTLAARLASGPTAAYATSKELLAAAAAGTSLEDVLASEGRAQARLGRSVDHRAAVTAFLAKERPTFVGC